LETKDPGGVFTSVRGLVLVVDVVAVVPVSSARWLDSKGLLPQGYGRSKEKRERNPLIVKEC